MHFQSMWYSVKGIYFNKFEWKGVLMHAHVYICIIKVKLIGYGFD